MTVKTTNKASVRRTRLEQRMVKGCNIRRERVWKGMEERMMDGPCPFLLASDEPCSTQAEKLTLHWMVGADEG